jgi:RNA polymerase sigma-70 factor (ECF subfamily)
MVSSLKVGEDLSKRAPDAAAYAAVVEDMTFVYLLRDGDEAAFEQLVDRYYGLTLRVARSYVRSQALAEEVAQEAWIGIIKGLQRFEGRSSLKTWIVRIVMNIANNIRARAVRESRSVPFSELSDDDGIDRTRFRGVEDPYPGHWTSPPRTWRVLPDEATSMRETLEVVRDVVEALPEKQRLVFTLRDIEGWDTADIAQALDVSDNNQRVLLHRARTKVRAVLEGHLADE